MAGKTGKADKTAKTPADVLIEGPSEETTITVGNEDVGTVAPGEKTDALIEGPSEEALLTVGNEEVGTVVPEEETVSKRTAVVFLGPYRSYSRGDTACFDNAVSIELEEDRKVAVWPKDAKKALAARPGEFDHDTDIG